MITKERLLKFRDMTSDLYAYYDENEKLNELIDNISEEFHEMMKSIEDLIPQNNPTCPYCQVKMNPTTYKGYYESFNYWQCNCEEDDSFKQNVVRGSFV